MTTGIKTRKKNLIRPQKPKRPKKSKKPKRPKKSKKPKRPKRVCLRQLFSSFLFYLATFWVGKENWSRQNSSSIFLKRNYFFVVFVFRPDNFWSIDISPNEKFQTLPTKRQMRKICWKQLRKKRFQFEETSLKWAGVNFANNDMSSGIRKLGEVLAADD